jgi:predicted dehydrogenase
MIHLAAIGADTSRIEAIASRLRGVLLAAQPTDACQGAVFLGPPFNDVERWLQAGKPVLVASALSRENLQKLMSVAHPANLVCANPNRHLPSRQLIHRQLHAGPLGVPGLIEIHRWEPVVNEAALLGDLDLIAWYFRANPNVTYAVAHARGTQIHLGFASGCSALVDHSRVPTGEAYCSLSVIAAQGAAYQDDHQNTQLVYRGGAPQAIRSDEGIGQWVAMVQEFADEIATKGERRMERPQFAVAVAIADAVETSLKTKQAVPLCWM